MCIDSIKVFMHTTESNFEQKMCFGDALVYNLLLSEVVLVEMDPLFLFKLNFFSFFIFFIKFFIFAR